MGEARIRKQNDPNYGKIPKAHPKRGLVICPPIKIEGQELVIRKSNIDEMELRFGLLYWDRLVWPTSRSIYLSNNPDEQFLEDAGILRRPDYTFFGGLGFAIVMAQIKAFQDLNNVEPGAWALSQGENSLLVRGGIAEEGKGGLIELHRAIPIPNHDVPLAEILEFKERRKGELNSLRHHLDKLLQEVGESENRQDSLRQKVSEVDAACAALLSVGKEWQFPVRISNLKASFTISARNIAAWAIGGWALGRPFGLTYAATAAALGGAASILEIKGDIGLKSPFRPKSPFRYAYKAHEELR